MVPPDLLSSLRSLRFGHRTHHLRPPTLAGFARFPHWLALPLGPRLGECGRVPVMLGCPRCRATYPDDLSECPADGVALLPVEALPPAEVPLAAGTMVGE